MRLDRYREVLAVRGFRPVMLLGLLAKLPVVAIPIVLTLHVTLGLDQGYGQAGLVAGAWTVGVTVGSPFQGRFIDRRGLRAMLSIATVAQGFFWGLAPLMSFPVFLVGALVSGLVLVPGSTVIRLAIAGLVPQEHRHTAFSMDSMVTELSYMAGPALVVLAATLISTETALVCVGLMLVVGSGALAVRNPRTEDKTGVGEPSARAGAFRSWLTVRLVAVCACTLAAGAVVAGYEVAIIGTLRSVDQVEWTGLVLFGCGVYSLVGGLVFGALPRSLPVPLVIVLLGLATLPLGLVGDWRVLALAVAPAAALCAPAFASTASAASVEVVEEGSRATTMSVYGAALSAGSALGAPMAGAAFDLSGPEAGFASVGGLGVVVAIFAWVVLRRSKQTPVASRVAFQGVSVER